MKIIRPGNAVNVLQGMCHRCQCLIACSPDECREVVSEDRRLLAVDCPTQYCGGIIYPKLQVALPSSLPPAVPPRPFRYDPRSKPEFQ